MDTLSADELKLFVESVREYFRVVTRQEPQITSAFLATGELQGHDYNGIADLTQLLRLAIPSRAISPRRPHPRHRR